MSDKLADLEKKYAYATNTLPINPDITWLLAEVRRLRAELASVVSHDIVPFDYSSELWSPNNHD
jgi:hypothetical protein